MSDAPRFFPDDPEIARLHRALSAEVAPLFDRDDWQATLATRFPHPIPGRWETTDQQIAAITVELDRARDELQSRLGRPVRHVCLPWGITGRHTRTALARLGFSTAFANRLRGRMAVGAGDDPFFLKRLHSRFLFSLPGTGRRVFAFAGR